jgi:hypothetical protein
MQAWTHVRLATRIKLNSLQRPYTPARIQTRPRLERAGRDVTGPGKRTQMRSWMPGNPQKTDAAKALIRNFIGKPTDNSVRCLRCHSTARINAVPTLAAQFGGRRLRTMPFGAPTSHARSGVESETKARTGAVLPSGGDKHCWASTADRAVDQGDYARRCGYGHTDRFAVICGSCTGAAGNIFAFVDYTSSFSERPVRQVPFPTTRLCPNSRRNPSIRDKW